MSKTKKNNVFMFLCQKLKELCLYVLMSETKRLCLYVQDAKL